MLKINGICYISLTMIFFLTVKSVHKQWTSVERCLNFLLTILTVINRCTKCPIITGASTLLRSFFNMPCIRSAGVIVITTFIIDGTCICKAGLVFLTSIITNGTLIELAGIAVITRSISDLCCVNSAKHYTCIEAITTIRANFVVTAKGTSVRCIATVVAFNLFPSIICEETFRFHEFKKEDKS